MSAFTRIDVGASVVEERPLGINNGKIWTKGDNAAINDDTAAAARAEIAALTHEALCTALRIEVVNELEMPVARLADRCFEVPHRLS